MYSLLYRYRDAILTPMTGLTLNPCCVGVLEILTIALLCLDLVWFGMWYCSSDGALPAMPDEARDTRFNRAKVPHLPRHSLMANHTNTANTERWLTLEICFFG